MEWFRWWHGTLTDPKFKWVARKSGCQFTAVITLWAALLERASSVTDGDASVTRGDVTGFDCDAHDALFDVDDGTCARIYDALVTKGLIDGGRIVNWGKRQPKREDSSAERTRAYRARQKADPDVAHGDASVTRGDDKRREEEIRGELTHTNTNVLVVDSEAADHPQERPTTKKPDCPHQEIIAAYHELLPASPAIRDWTPARAAHLRTRWNEDPKRQSLDWWRRFFAYVAESAFLTGNVTSGERKPFTVSLDWLCKAENFAKVREGRFHDAEAA
ncbi:hypothetical protein [Paraburkholderia sp.]|uniref:hypothetical protein n=1 Tax=Paraburkholderia sp. TaxID=1926495 RepID=UPI003C7BFB85